MKNIVILDCGPSLEEVSKKFGESPNWIMSSLKQYDINFTWIKCYNNESFNSSFGDAWIITGSPHSVYNEEKWMLNLEKNIRNAAKINKPILGICFGHQILAKSFGGEVKLNSKGWELGSYSIELTKEGLTSMLFNNIKNNTIVYESHQDIVVNLPDEATILAKNNKGIQSFKLTGSIYGVQFHPEFSYEILKEYVKIRTLLGVKIDNPLLPKSIDSNLVLNNFVNLIKE